MNSRHPGPRRVWKVGSVARWLQPLQVDPVDPAQCTKRWFRVRETIFFPPRRHSNLSLAKAWPEAAQWAPKGPQRAPKGAQGHPRGAKEAESRAKGNPKDGQREPKVTPGEQKGRQSRPKGSQGTPKSPQRKPQARQRRPWEARETRYTFQTPDQPHSGHYVK